MSTSGLQVIRHYLDGRFVEDDSSGFLERVNPATGETSVLIPQGNAEIVDRAVSAARSAFVSWSRTSASERSKLLLAVAQRIEENLDQLAEAETNDTGKPLRLSKTVDVPRAAANFRFFATAILHECSEAYRTDQLALNYVLRQPRGVAGLISPWNLPLYLFTWKVAPALATGNTVVAKPSELTPTTAWMLSELVDEVGFPPGVFNVVHGRGDVVGAALVAHPEVPTISFTGGTAIGAEIAQTAAPLFKKVALELGGKNPNLIFADADLDAALAATMRSSFENQGEICLCGSRIFVERSIFQPFVARFVEATRALKIGDPLDSDTQQGAIISRQHLDRIEHFLQIARDEGGEILCGGKRPLLNGRCAGGFFLEPTVIVGLDPECRVNQQEIFGPVVTVTPFDHEQQVVEWANGTRFGLSATLWTRDLDRAHRVAEQLECGTVWVNCWLLRDLRVPFGGIKSSGVGKEGGDEALRFFTEPKTVCLKLAPEHRR